MIQKFLTGRPIYNLPGSSTPLQGYSSFSHNLRKRLYLNVKPLGYENFASRLLKGVFGVKLEDRDNVTPQENAMWARYLNLEPEDTNGVDWREYLEITDARPSKGNIDSGRPYYKITKGHNPLVNDDYSLLLNGESKTVEGNGAGMGTYTISKGDGFRSYHDIWDINPLKGVSSKIPLSVQKYIPDFDFGKIIGTKEYGIYERDK